ncbi:hypothetical protein ACFQ0T_42920 [Kitasatospora gansuensis]
MALIRGFSESKPSSSTDTPDHVDSSGRSWTGADYDEGRANGRPLHAPGPTTATTSSAAPPDHRSGAHPRTPGGAHLT